MRIAISTDEGRVSAHFGRCPSFTIADVEEGKVISSKVIDNPGHHPGFLPKFLHSEGVHCIIAGGMGHKAIMLFKEQEIEVVVGVSGTTDEVLDLLVRGKLEGGESLCKPGGGKGYGVEKEDQGKCEEDHHH